MTQAQLIAELMALTEAIDQSIDGVTAAATQAQKLIYEAILQSVNRFQIQDGRYVVNQDYASRILALERKITAILGDIYAPQIREYLGSYDTIEATNIALHKSYNDLEIETSMLTPARKAVYDQAEYYLSKGLAPAYIQPAKYLLMQHVTTGLTIKESEKILRHWNEGTLQAPALISGIPTPNLQRYATQVARDSAHQFNGAINEVIADKFELTHFMYVGDIIEDSRPGCKYLVGLRRKIDINEVPGVIKKYPQGVIPGTTKANFFQRRMGYGCRHTAMAVKG